MYNAPNESVASRDARDGIQHNLRALAARKGADELGRAVVAQAEHGVAEDLWVESV